MLKAVVTPAAYGHFAMPRSFYMFTSIVVVGYFVVIAGSSLLNSWRARYREAMSERSELTAGACAGARSHCSIDHRSHVRFLRREIVVVVCASPFHCIDVGWFGDLHKGCGHRCNAVHLHLVLMPGVDVFRLAKVSGLFTGEITRGMNV